MPIAKGNVTDLDRVLRLRSRLYLLSGQFACRNHVSTFLFPTLDHSPAPRSLRSHCFSTAKNPPQADWRERSGLWRHGQTSPFFLLQVRGDGGHDGCHYPSVIFHRLPPCNCYRTKICHPLRMVWHSVWRSACAAMSNSGTSIRLLVVYPPPRLRPWPLTSKRYRGQAGLTRVCCRASWMGYYRSYSAASPGRE